jgi:hypothetical protein
VAQLGQLVREVIGEVVGIALRYVAASKRDEMQRKTGVVYSTFARRLEWLVGRGHRPVPAAGEERPN